jgi:hypothetical protein
LDSTVLNDPAGLVARSPELARLAERAPALRRAIERGRPLDAYRALFWAHRRKGLGDLSELAAALLARRRLFIKPLTSAPSMFTYNGVGTKLYGESDRDLNDGTYVATLFAVFVFIPIFPIGSYLVHDSPQNGSRRAWSFLAKVPLSTAHHFWQRAMALGAVGSLVFGLGGALEGYGHNTLQVVNGLPAAVSVQLDHAAAVSVPAEGRTAIRTTAATHTITVRAGNDVIESAAIVIPHGRVATAWNILGGAPLFSERVVYASGDKPQQDAQDPVVYCGQSLVSVEWVDYAFEEPPKSISMSSGTDSVTKIHLDTLKGGAHTCEDVLLRRDDTLVAARLAMRVARALRQPASSLDQDSIRLELASVPPAEAEAFAKELVARDGSLEAHRLYQDVLVESDQRARAIAEYTARRDAEPGSPDAEYLALRLQPIESERRVIDGLVARYPEHAYLRRTHAFVHFAVREFAPVVESIDVLRKIARPMWTEMLEMQVEALLGLGEGDVALTRLIEVAEQPSTNPETRKSAKFMAYRVAYRLGAPLPALDVGDAAGPEIKLLVRATAGAEIAESEIASLKDPDVKDALDVVVDARSNPDRALERVRRMNPQAAGILPSSVRVLLLAEAERRGKADGLDKLIGGPLGRHTVDAIAAVVLRGDESDDVAQLTLEMRAAIDFVRSRTTGLTDKERAFRLARAKAGDVYRGPVSVAIAQWPS